jgi:hypothetical protein
MLHDSETFSDVTASRSLHLQTALTTRPTARDAYEYFKGTGDTGTQVLNFSTMYNVMYRLHCSKFPLSSVTPSPSRNEGK